MVIADREFIGRPFMSYLTAHGVGYGVRIRKDAQVGFRGRTQRADHLFGDLAVGQHRRLRARRTLYGQKLWLYALRLPDTACGERRLLIVAGTVRRLLRLYRLRWSIEVLFAGLKARGFDFFGDASEHTEENLDVGGAAGDRLQPRPCHGSVPGPAEADPAEAPWSAARSVFRLGLDHLRHVLLQGLDRVWQGLLSLFIKGALGPAPVPL